MITKKTKNLIEAAKNDLVFQEELRVHEPNDYKLKQADDDIKRSIYACIYMGWLIGKGTYKESDYE